MPGNSPGGGQTTKSLLIRRKVREFSYRSQHRFILLSTVLAAFVFGKISFEQGKSRTVCKTVRLLVWRARTLSLAWLDNLFPLLASPFSPDRGKSIKGRALGKTINLAWTAKASHFGRGGIAQAMTERARML